MALPKKQPIVDTDIQNTGIKRLRDIVLQSDENTTYLPRGIKFEDIDVSFFEKVENGSLSIIIDGNKIPVIYMTNERWGEFERTWQYQDDDKLLLTPFITIKRVNKQPGTIYGGIFTVSNRKTFNYIDVPTLEDGFYIFTRYKIPQPVAIDLTYDVTLFSKYQEDVNKFDELMMTRFSSRQEYLNVYGHYFPVIREGIEITDDVDDVDGNKLYKTNYEIKVMGYIQNPEEFEITKTVKRTKIELGI